MYVETNLLLFKENSLKTTNKIYWKYFHLQQNYKWVHKMCVIIPTKCNIIEVKN